MGGVGEADPRSVSGGVLFSCGSLTPDVDEAVDRDLLAVTSPHHRRQMHLAIPAQQREDHVRSGQNAALELVFAPSAPAVVRDLRVEMVLAPVNSIPDERPLFKTSPIR